MTARVRLAIRVVVIAAVGVALAWFVRAMDLRRLGQELASARVELIAVAVALTFACRTGKAVAWRVLLAPRHVVAMRRLVRYEIVSVAASALTPARAGEVLRVWLLRRRDGVPAADSVATIAIHKLLDGVAMVLFALPLSWLIPGLPPWVGRALVVFASVVLGALGGLAIVARRRATGDAAPPTTLRGRVLAGMRALRDPRRLAWALLALLAVWAADLTAVTAVLRAVDLQLPLAAGLLILFTLNLAILVPSTPAQVGTLEVGALAALELLHVDPAAALAFALLYHAGQVIPTLIAGLILELRLVTGRERTD